MAQGKYLEQKVLTSRQGESDRSEGATDVLHRALQHPPTMPLPIDLAGRDNGEGQHLPQGGDMYEQANTKTVQQLYDNFRGKDFRSADMKSMLGLYSDDVDWRVPEMENVRIGGKRKGREGVKEFFSTIAEHYELLQFEPKEFIAQDDKVVALGRYSWRVRSTGLEFSSDWAHVYTVRDGKIVRFHEYMDTAAELRAHRKRQEP
jgi:uncharacterized protein